MRVNESVMILKFSKVFKALKKSVALKTVVLLYMPGVVKVFESKKCKCLKSVCVCIDKHCLLVVYLYSGEVYNI